MDIGSGLCGAAVVSAGWFFWLGAKKAVPAAIGWIRGKWTAGASELTELENRFASEIDHAHGVIGEIEQRVTALEGKLVAAPVAAKPSPPAPAPAPVTPAPAAAPAAAAPIAPAPQVTA